MAMVMAVMKRDHQQEQRPSACIRQAASVQKSQAERLHFGGALHLRLACNLRTLNLPITNPQGSVGEVERFLEAQGLLDGARQASATVVCKLRTLTLTPADPQGSVGEVERFLEAQGLNARALLDGARQASATAGDALETARPTVDSTVSTVSSTLLSTDPVVLAEYAAGLVALYYLVRLPWGSGQI